MKRLIFFLAIFLMIVPETIFAQEFNFYGAKFGMTKAEVGKFFNIEDSYGKQVVKKPGYYMKYLYLDFDHKDRLFRIRAYYPLDGEEEDQALSIALKEIFEDSIKRSNKGVEVKIAPHVEVGSRTLLMKLVSNSLYSEYMNNLKMEIIKKMK